MKIQPNENDLRKFIFDHLDAWYERIEPSRGMHAGIPDALVMTESIGLLPVEFKIGRVNDNRLELAEVRPAQVSWHTSFAMQNKDKMACSVFVVGCWSEDKKTWNIFAFDGAFANQWEEGFSLDDPILYPFDHRFAIECLEGIVNDILDSAE